MPPEKTMSAPMHSLNSYVSPRLGWLQGLSLGGLDGEGAAGALRTHLSSDAGCLQASTSMPMLAGLLI